MYSAAVITISDKGSVGQRIDTSGPAICEVLKKHNYDIKYTNIISDDISGIENELIKCVDELNIQLIITTGGTGFSIRDNTPEATLKIIQKNVPGIPEMMRQGSLTITNKACLSREVAGIRNKSLIINLPGSKKASVENLLFVIEPIEHGLEILNGQGSANCGEGERNEIKN